MAVSRVINLQHHRIAQVSVAFVSSSCLPHLWLVMLPISFHKSLLCALSYPWKEHPPGWKWACPGAIWAWNNLLAFIVVWVRPPIQIQISPKMQQMVPATQGRGVLCHQARVPVVAPKLQLLGKHFGKKENVSCFWKNNILELLWGNHFLQCRTVKIAILGEEGVPVQVDGEAWIQPPGYIWIVHKNRAQTLTRDRVRAAVHTLCSTHMFWCHIFLRGMATATHESLSLWM